MGEPVKVLAVVCQMNRGGLESRLLDILRFIDRSRVEIDVYTRQEDKGFLDDQVTATGSKIFYNRPLTMKNFTSYHKYFAQFLREHPEYKVVHVHQDAFCGVFCKGAMEAGVPVRIAHSRRSQDEPGLKTLIRDLVKKDIIKYATHLFAVSKEAGVWLFGKKQVDEGNVTIWPNAIDARQFSYSEGKRNQVRKQMGWEGKKVLIHVGNFTTPKNHPFLIDVFDAYVKQNEDARLVLVGRGDSEKTKAEEKAKALGIEDKVEFLGGREDVNLLLQGADCFVFPSFNEGFPGAVLEAQAAGLPCLISDRITDEVVLLESTRKLSIEKAPSEWCSEIDKLLKIDRIDTYDLIQQSGYDIVGLVHKLEEFYISCKTSC